MCCKEKNGCNYRYREAECFTSTGKILSDQHLIASCLVGVRTQSKNKSCTKNCCAKDSRMKEGNNNNNLPKRVEKSWLSIQDNTSWQRFCVCVWLTICPLSTLFIILFFCSDRPRVKCSSKVIKSSIGKLNSCVRWLVIKLWNGAQLPACLHFWCKWDEKVEGEGVRRTVIGQFFAISAIFAGASVMHRRTELPAAKHERERERRTIVLSLIHLHICHDWRFAWANKASEKEKEKEKWKLTYLSPVFKVAMRAPLWPLLPPLQPLLCSFPPHLDM